MDYNTALNYIFSLDRFGGVAGLERITPVLEYFGNPQNKVKSLHIAGTNGKGSVAAMLNSCLQAAGYKVGLYMSPFIIEFCERIQINSQYISKEILADLVEMVKDTCEKLDITLGQFEFITVVAFLYFEKENCNYMVLETGLGGRCDATNMVVKPEVSIITSISLDHTAILGDTISKIAKEKAGIIKSSVPVVTEAQENDAILVIKEACKQQNANLTVTDLPTNIYIGIDSTNFNYKGLDYNISLVGKHQAYNATLCIEALKQLGVDNKYICKGLANTVHPARLEIISKKPLVVLDGAHNEGGAKALAEYLKTTNFKGTAIVAAMQDKDAKTVAKEIAPYLNNIIAVKLHDNPRALPPQKLAEYFSSFCNVELAENYREALALAEGSPLLVCGSLYLAADIRPMLLQKYKI